MDATTIAEEYFKNWSLTNPNLSLGIGAIATLDHVIQNIELASLGELINITLPKVSTTLIKCFPGSMSVLNACKIYSSVVTRGDVEGIQDITSVIRSNSKNILESATLSHSNIHKWVNTFLRDGQIILIHSYSHVVTSALLTAAQMGKRFRVIITESRPECEGYVLAAKLKEHGIPITLIVDSMVAHVLATVDLVLVGAEAVVENGGIINKVGTYQLGIVAKALNKPIYVLAESFKFCRLFIFNQQDIEDNVTALIQSAAKQAAMGSVIHQPQSPIATSITEPQLSEDTSSAASTLAVAQPHTICQHHVPLVIQNAICYQHVDNSEYLDHKWDYTPPEYITLIFSDIGILSPSAVSDELFKLSY